MAIEPATGSSENRRDTNEAHYQQQGAPSDYQLSRSEFDDEYSCFDQVMGIRAMLVAFAGSSVYTIIAYIFPVLKNLPIFGPILADEWAWTLNLSPAYMGFGMIIHPSINVAVVFGALFGWGILSPLAHNKGWAPGPVRDWDSGSQGWIIWIGMGLLLGDSIVGLSWLIINPIITGIGHSLSQLRVHPQLKYSQTEYVDERSALIPEPNHNAAEMVGIRSDDESEDSIRDDQWPAKSRVTLTLNGWLFPIVFITSAVALFCIFPSSLPLWAIAISISLVPTASFVSMRCYGQVDSAGMVAISRTVQFLLRFCIPPSTKNHFTYNIAMGGVVEAGAFQAALHMGWLKTAHMTRTPPRAIFYGHIIGSIIGAVVSVLLYRLYGSEQNILSGEFLVPDGHMWLITTRLIYQRGLPPKVFSFTIGSFVFGAISGLLRMIGKDRWWQPFLPSGIAVALGMYVPPALTLPRALGSLIFCVLLNRTSINRLTLICAASGMILGEEIFSAITLTFRALGIFLG